MDVKTRPGASVSLWQASADIPPRPRLDADAAVDVCIVGAGIAGLTTAYELARMGRSVLVLDERDVGAGQTGRTTGHLCDALDDRYYALARLHGADGARLAASTHAAAVDRIEAICRDEDIDCDFQRVDGFLVLGDEPPDPDALDKEVDAAREAGVQIEWPQRLPVAFSGFGRALCFGRQAQFHSLKYLSGLAAAVERHGGLIRSGTRVCEVFGGDDAGVATANGHRVRAAHVVVAANTPFNDRLAIHTKQYAYRTYVIALECRDATVPDALLWDTLDPYHYVRTATVDGRRWWIVGGEDHKVGQQEEGGDPYATLEQWVRRHLPGVGDVGYRWSGQVYEPADSLGFLGRNPGSDDNVYVVTGDSGNGLTHATIAGGLIARLIAGEEPDATALYAPNRKNAKSADEYLKENANMAAQYRDLVTPGEVGSVDDVPRGEGRIVRVGIAKHAVYRDDDGVLHARLANCPHLGAIVRWNPLENSWDCPAHGSRFEPCAGACLNGPAPRGLQAVDD